MFHGKWGFTEQFQRISGAFQGPQLQGFRGLREITKGDLEFSKRVLGGFQEFEKDFRR